MEIKKWFIIDKNDMNNPMSLGYLFITKEEVQEINSIEINDIIYDINEIKGNDIIVIKRN